MFPYVFIIIVLILILKVDPQFVDDFWSNSHFDECVVAALALYAKASLFSRLFFHVDSILSRALQRRKGKHFGFASPLRHDVVHIDSLLGIEGVVIGCCSRPEVSPISDRKKKTKIKNGVRESVLARARAGREGQN